jgi:small subunit ribosomal protein S16
MSVRIRLRRVGRKKQPYYRLVVADKLTPRDGAYIDSVGFYDPRRQPAELKIDLGRVDDWLARGAQLSETAASLVRKARKGGDAGVVIMAPTTAEPAAAVPAAGEQAAPAAEPAVAPAAVPVVAPAAEPVVAPAAEPEPAEDAGGPLPTA